MEWSTHLLANPLFSGDRAKLSTIGRGSVGCEILCFRPEELVLDLGSLELVELRPAFSEVERLNHFVGLERNCVIPLEGETEREGGPEVLAPVGNAISGGLSEFDDAPRRGAMVVGHKKERRSKRR